MTNATYETMIESFIARYRVTPFDMNARTMTNNEIKRAIRCDDMNFARLSHVQHALTIAQ